MSFRLDLTKLCLTRVKLSYNLCCNYSTWSKNIEKNSNSYYNYCVDLVKKNDFNLYLSTLISPEPVLRAAFAIKSFNIELLSISKSGNDNRIPQIKIQFWKEQLDKIFVLVKSSKETGNNEPFPSAGISRKDVLFHEPISNELAAIIRKHNLNRVWFNRLIDGRRLYLTTQQFKTFDELEKCADSSQSSIYYILLNCMNIKSIDCDHAASHLGKAEMICGLVRNLVRRRGQAVDYLPMELIIKHQMSQQELLNLNDRVIKAKQKNLRDLLFDMCSRADQHLKSARKLKSKVPKEARVLFASSFICEIFLNKMLKYDFDITNRKLNDEFRTSIITKLILAKYLKSF